MFTAVGRSPLAPHTATPRELQERLEAEREGVPFLIYRDGDGHQRLLQLAADRPHLTVGRRASADLALPWDTEVSRLHAELERIGNDWTVADDGLSHNGTFLNGQRVTGRKRVRNGDALTFGNTIVSFREPKGQISDPTTTPAQTAPGQRLTEAQRRLLICLARPYRESSFASPASNRQIADELHLSVDAIKAQLRGLYQLIGIEHLPQNQKRAALVLEAFGRGLILPRDLWS
jgi:pSer/pThr/pTyr-binding forkhead associated (FHA) protein